MAGRRAVFLDRDGVLNEAVTENGRPRPPVGVEDVILRHGVREACHFMRQAGLLLIVVTNQPDIARGTTSSATVGAVNDHLQRELALDAVFVCPHDDVDRCGCRKPAPGLLFAAAEQFGIDLARSVMVGDRWRDVEAGARAGVRTVWVRADYRERAPDAPDYVVDGLLDAARIVATEQTAEEDLR